MASWLRKLVLAAAVVAAWAAGRALDEAADAQRLDSTQVQALVPNDRRKDLLIAMVTVQRGDGTAFEYLRSQGLWRCRQAFGAVADATHVQQLVDALLLAEGTVHSDVPERAGDYGFDVADTWTVKLHGTQALNDPEGDVQLELELGASLPELDGSFVRLPGETLVRAIDTDPRALLDVSGPNPPLLDARLIPGSWPGTAARIERVQVDRAEDAFLLTLDERELDAAMQAVAASPVEWTLTRVDSSTAITSPDHAIAFTVFLRLVTWAGVVSPERVDELVGERVTARLTLVPSRGEPLVLLFGVPMADGRVPVIQGLTRMLHLLDPAVAELLLPTSAALLEPGAPNPWEPWLTQAAQPMLPR